MKAKTRTISLRVSEETYRKLVKQGPITPFVTDAIEYRLKWLDVKKRAPKKKKQPYFWDEDIAHVIELAMEQWKKENGVD